ncbi:glycosyltransferase family A protein [Paracoccus sp. Z330]|uniref:Glycosyltransferase family A protein n=1 Tax=Paracoccus onchidii TaxID=3017813 RepID=A0ABT4ZFZ5_9RHOB|nr:glycosyltransferase family A protein [Paracoccus onchidii]MDB6178300.1 glycosyltransferase family A protein [Paracoccus onchidii]
MTGLVISLTTIPPRLNRIHPTLRDLLNQTAPIDEIRLYLPRRHRRFPLLEAKIPELPNGIKLILIDDDWGPATKVLPAAQDLRGQDVELIFCDDDQKYDPDWAMRFLEARKQLPDACLVQKGYNLEDRPNGTKYFPLHDASQYPRAQRFRRDMWYRLRRAASFGSWRPAQPFSCGGYVDILEGYRGAMIRPDFLPQEAWNIPDVLWTVDDPWLSGHLLRNNHPIWLISDCPPPIATHDAHHVSGLRDFVYQGHGRREADTLAIEYFRKHHRLWPDRLPPQQRVRPIPPDMA